MRFTFVTFAAFAILATGTNATTLYRGGNASTAVNGVKSKDFGNPSGGHYHPNGGGLSTFSDPSHIRGNQKHVYSIDSKAAERAGFKVTNDGTPEHTHHSIGLKAQHPEGTLHGALQGMDWAYHGSKDAAIAHYNNAGTRRDLGPMNRVRMVHEAVQKSKRSIEDLD